MPVSVAYLRHRLVPPRVRAFVDWLAELFETARHVSHELPPKLPHELPHELSGMRPILRGMEADEPA
jgi:LysR family transcriptional regulator, regulator for bpeEF and oprC